LTIWRTCRLIDEATYQQVFGWWVLKPLARDGLIQGKIIGIDWTTLEANAVMKSMVGRDTQESYSDYLQRLTAAEGRGGARRSGPAAHGPEAIPEDV
jgi:hypothetical protein